MAVDPEPEAGPRPSDSQTETQDQVSGPYAWYVLGVLVLVYVFNFIDRSILSILAEDLKADLGITDAQLGFLYGTAFAVFYAVLGIPLARLADVWTRNRLISIGLLFWSAMTALSGTARSVFSLGAYRIGVGVGEASASPAAFSMLGDYFPPRMRATIVAIYSSGVYIGAGIGTMIGGIVVDHWNAAYSAGDAPFGLAGWQAAFFVVGIPGLFMAAWVWTLREPIRGLTEGIATKQSQPDHPLRTFLRELGTVLPPFTIINLIRQNVGLRAVGLNIFFAVAIGLGAWGLTAWIGSMAQWCALGVGLYAVASWIQSLAYRDKVAFEMIFKSKAMIFGQAGFGFIAFKTYGIGFWLPPFLMRAHGASPAQVGLLIGLGGAAGGMIGVTSGGILSDRLKKYTPRARLYMGYVAMGLTLPIAVPLLLTDNLTLCYILAPFNAMLSSMWIGSAIALSNELVLPRIRATASSFYILMVTFIGLAMGPFTIGRISDYLSRSGTAPSEALRQAMLLGLLSMAIASVFLALAAYYVPREENSRLDRARAAGEPGI